MVNVKSHMKVEALALKAKDLMKAISTSWWLFRRNFSGLDSDYPEEKWKPLAISAMQSIWRRGITRRKKPMASLRIEDGVGKSQTMKHSCLNRRLSQLAKASIN
ncbi:hypothetical protein FNV43_RR08715 [Rhamnella rubrinervis]|uniref:Uncharacterized protein n=1 Tax=Rhamnella rubrinervis TaxID=2594499 RepID=A0A8K0H8Q5_9ROSA|nr:hypothetical protein FNV43_RR08715 [Rhamnella rubrinervis]